VTKTARCVRFNFVCSRLEWFKRVTLLNSDLKLAGFAVDLDLWDVGLWLGIDLPNARLVEALLPLLLLVQVFGLVWFILRPCQHDNGYIDGRSQIKVHTDERTQVHSALVNGHRKLVEVLLSHYYWPGSVSIQIARLFVRSISTLYWLRLMHWFIIILLNDSRWALYGI